MKMWQKSLQCKNVAKESPVKLFLIWGEEKISCFSRLPGLPAGNTSSIGRGFLKQLSAEVKGGAYIY